MPQKLFRDFFFVVVQCKNTLRSILEKKKHQNQSVRIVLQDGQMHLRSLISTLLAKSLLVELVMAPQPCFNQISIKGGRKITEVFVILFEELQNTKQKKPLSWKPLKVVVSAFTEDQHSILVQREFSFEFRQGKRVFDAQVCLRSFLRYLQVLLLPFQSARTFG